MLSKPQARMRRQHRTTESAYGQCCAHAIAPGDPHGKVERVYRHRTTIRVNSSMQVGKVEPVLRKGFGWKHQQAVGRAWNADAEAQKRQSPFLQRTNIGYSVIRRHLWWRIKIGQRRIESRAKYMRCAPSQHLIGGCKAAPAHASVIIRCKLQDSTGSLGDRRNRSHTEFVGKTSRRAGCADTIQPDQSATISAAIVFC